MSSHNYTIADGPKMLLETICVAQAAIGNSPHTDSRASKHIARLQHLADECNRKHPVGPDGKHNNRHTAECGCTDT